MIRATEDILVELARDLRALGRLDKAKEILLRAIESDAAHVGALVELAQICRDRRDAVGALAALEAATKVAPANVDVRIALAVEYSEQNRFDEAFRTLEEILATHPHHVAALMRLARLHRTRGDRRKSHRGLTLRAKTPIEQCAGTGGTCARNLGGR